SAAAGDAGSDSSPVASLHRARPKKRLHDIGDARLEIDEALMAPEDPKALPVTASARGRPRGWHAAVIAGAVAVLSLASLDFREAPPPEHATVLSILPPENATSVDRASVSLDGRTIAFVAASKTPHGTISYGENTRRTVRARKDGIAGVYDGFLPCAIN